MTPERMQDALCWLTANEAHVYFVADGWVLIRRDGFLLGQGPDFFAAVDDATKAQGGG